MSELDTQARSWVSGLCARSNYSFTDLAACAESELHSRKSRYPGYIARHRMSQQAADAELEKMAEIGELLRALAKTEQLV